VHEQGKSLGLNKSWLHLVAGSRLNKFHPPNQTYIPRDDLDYMSLHLSQKLGYPPLGHWKGQTAYKALTQYGQEELEMGVVYS
jgi:uncharacterized protein (DUF427 family)